MTWKLGSVLAACLLCGQIGHLERSRGEGIQAYDSANAALRAGDYYAAIAEFNKAIGEQTSDVPSLCGRGLAYLRIAEYDKALTDFDAALALAEDEPLAHYGRGHALSRRGRPHEAMCHLTKAIALAPDGDSAFLAYCVRAVLFLRFDDRTQAIEDATKALAMRPLRAEGHVARGCLYMYSIGSEPDEEDDGRIKAMKSFDQALELEPHCIAALHYRADMLAREPTLWIDALIAYDKAIRTHGEDRRNPLLGILLAARASILVNFAQHEAISDAERAVQLAPREPIAYIVLGDILDHSREYERAAEMFGKAITLGDPLESRGYVLRGQTYAALGRHPEAIADYSHALLLPQYEAIRAGVLCSRALTFDAIGNHRNAIADFDRAIELSPEKGEYYGHRALAYDALDDHEKATADFIKAIRLAPGKYTLHANYAMALLRDQKLDAALDSINTAIRLAPSKLVLYDFRADIYDAMGRGDDARADRARAESTDATQEHVEGEEGQSEMSR